MKPKFVGAAEFRAQARRGAAKDLGVLGSASVLRTPSDGSRKVSWVLSDGSVDREGDRIDPNGWDLTSFRRNAVVLWGHDSSAPPIGRAIGVHSDGTRLLADIEFATGETSAFADTIFRLVKDGFIKAGSVGFMPIDYAFTSDKNRPNGIDFKRQELLEFSICSVPANANALVEARAKAMSKTAAATPAAPQSEWDRRREMMQIMAAAAKTLIRLSSDEFELGKNQRRLRHAERELRDMDRSDEIMAAAARSRS